MPQEIIIYKSPLEKLIWDFWLSPGWFGYPWMIWGIAGLVGVFIAFICYGKLRMKYFFRQTRW